jgi:hypothetical protein
MLEGEGVKKMWDSANAIDAPYLPYTPDPTAPGNRPVREAPPDMPAAFTALTQMSVDMLKASDGIFDESQGKASNATSGRAIIARQREGDTATFDYQDALVMGKQSTGEIINYALPAIYDTPRQVRVIGKDGAEDFVQLYEEVRDQQTGQPVKVNDLSKGKYDITVSVGASYDTQRMEFVDALTQLGQGNPAIAAGVPDLIVGSMDFPKADEAAERLKLLLPPPIQQAMAQKDQSPAVMQLQGQMQQMQQVAEQHIGELQQQLQQAQQKAASRVDAEQKAANDHEKLRIDWFNAETERLKLYQSGAQHQAEMQAQHAQEATQQFNHERQFSADQFNGTEAE